MVPLPRRQVLRLLPHGHPGVVDENVHPPQLIHRLRHHPADVFFLGDIHRNPLATHPKLLDLGQRRRRLVLVASRHHDVGSCSRQPQGHRQPQTPVAPGHDGYPARQVKHPFSVHSNSPHDLSQLYHNPNRA